MTPPPTDAEFAILWEELGPNARRILVAIAERLVKGARQYGDFKPRRWTREALEEVLDLTVYLTAELLFATPPEETQSSSRKRLLRRLVRWYFGSAGP